MKVKMDFVISQENFWYVTTWMCIILRKKVIDEGHIVLTSYHNASL